MTIPTFYFQSLQSPTQFNLNKHLLQSGFKLANNAETANFNDANLMLNETYTEILEYKHLLARLIQKYHLNIMPATHIISDSNYIHILDMIKSEYYHNCDHVPELIWILKPALLNNGEGICLFDHLKDLYTHFHSTQRYAGLHVLQKYITHPHLLNNHKYTFRMFVIITNFQGAYLYRDGYFNVGRELYDPTNIRKINMHLTNEHLNPDHTPNIWQIPTSKCPNFDTIYQQMHLTVTAVIHALNAEAPQLFSQNLNANAFSLFGFDFILDDKLKLWLLEVNHGPCFPKENNHVLQAHLYNDFWKNIVDFLVTPIITHDFDLIKHCNLFNPITIT